MNDDLPDRFPKLEDSNLYWDLAQFSQTTLCFFLGHYPIRDNCGKPEHDYCAWCTKGMPNQAVE